MYEVYIWLVLTREESVRNIGTYEFGGRWQAACQGEQPGAWKNILVVSPSISMKLKCDPSLPFPVPESNTLVVGLRYTLSSRTRLPSCKGYRDDCPEPRLPEARLHATIRQPSVELTMGSLPS